MLFMMTIIDFTAISYPNIQVLYVLGIPMTGKTTLDRE